MSKSNLSTQLLRLWLILALVVSLAPATASRATDGTIGVPSPGVQERRAPSTPSVSATKSDALLVDNDGDGVADPGDTLRYTVVIRNDGDMDALGVVLSDTLDANTTLVPGSLTSTPLAYGQDVSVVEDEPQAIILQGSDPDGDTLTFSIVTSPTNGTLGPLSASPPVSASLIYTPTTNLTGADSFAFQVSDGVNTDQALVRITISERNDPPVVSGETFNNVVGNTALEFGNVASVSPAVYVAGDVLDNDADIDGPAPLIVSRTGTFASAQGGTVTMNAAGEFTYLPAAAFTASDSFTYTVSDGISNTQGTVNLTVANMVWYVDNTAGPGDGRSSSPFNSLANLNGPGGTGDPDGVGEFIYLFQGSGDYSGGLVLENNQQLVGQPAGLTVGDLTIAPSGSDPVIANASGDGISLASDNTLRGLTIGNTPNGTGIRGNAVGTLAIADMTIAGVGGGVDINGGSLAVSLESLNANSSTDAGIRLVNVGGAFAVPAGSISTTNVPAVEIDGAPLNVSITLTSISASSAANGILVRDTSGSFSVTGSGTTDGSGGTLQTLDDHGIELVNAQDVSISNMNLTNAATTQEVATNTPTCTDEPNGTNTGCNAPVHMVNVTNVSLTNLTINGSVQHGVNGNNVTGLTISNSDVSGIGDQPKENGMHFINLLGTVSLNNVSVTGSDTRNVLVENNTGTANISVTNSTFNTATREDGLAVIGGGTASITFNVTDSSFTENNAVQLKAHAEDSSTIDASFSGNAFDGNPAVTGNVGVDLAVRDGANLTFDVIGTLANPQTFQPFRSHAINVFASGGGTATGRVNGNTITGSSFGAGVRVVAQATDVNGFDPSITIEIDGNNISGVQGGGLAGIHIEARDGTNGLTGVGSIDATVTDNDVTTNNADAAIQVYLSDLNLASTPQNRVCLNATGNATQANGGAFGETDFFFGNDAISGANSGVAQMQGFATSVSNTWFNVNGNTTSTAPTPLALGLGPIGGGTCATAVLLSPSDSGVMVAQADDAALSIIDSVSVADVGETRLQAASVGTLLSQENIDIDIGTLPAGKAITLTFEVTINDPLPAGVFQVSSQGRVSGDNFADVLTDDPDSGAVGDPTVTPVDTPSSVKRVYLPFVASNLVKAPDLIVAEMTATRDKAHLVIKNE